MEHTCELFVIKRDGRREPVLFDKIVQRIRNLDKLGSLNVNYTNLAIKVIEQLTDNMKTSKIDELCGEQAATMATIHPDYGILAGRILISNHQKSTLNSMLSVCKELYEYSCPVSGRHMPVISKEFYELVCANADAIEAMIDYERDFVFDYFGFKTLERAYLFKTGKKIVERPQHMWMRVAIAIHGSDMEKVKTTYDLMSTKVFTHATPTLFNAGKTLQQLSSCYLVAMREDSIEGIYDTLKECALISKLAGGIGLHIHNIRANGTEIAGTGGTSNGIVEMLRVYNNTARYVDQCVSPDTLVYTTKGIKKISELSPKENAIINSTGYEETVENVLEHACYNADLLDIHTPNSFDPLTITPEHPILCVIDYEHYEFIESGRLSVGDMIATPIPQYTKDISEITSQECYMYGVITRFGNYSNSSPRVSLKVPCEHDAFAKWIDDYLMKKCITYDIFDSVYEGLSTSPGRSSHMAINTPYRLVNWEKSVNLPFKYSDFYDAAGTRQIHYRWLNLPIEKVSKMLIALYEMDANGQPFISTESKQFAEGIKYILLKMGVLPTCKTDTIYVDAHVKQTIYRVCIPKTRQICELLGLSKLVNMDVDYTRYRNTLVSTISKIDTLRTSSTTLYDLQMSKAHNYSTTTAVIHNGGGKRNGSFAIYLEPWHSDIMDFLEMKKNQGDEEKKARDLFYALWIPDLFMKRVEADGNWTLMCPHLCPGLSEAYGDEFDALYEKYERDGRGNKVVKARDVWFSILTSQIETGTPYMLFKDACNRKSNQKNLGTIKSSNLCTEIVEYSDAEETAVCNLASISLASFVDPVTKTYNYEKLVEAAGIVTENLNKVIDINYYPTPNTKRSNLRHRPIGIGVQGLADVFAMMGLAFDSAEAREINRLIFESIYYGAIKKSNEIAIERGEKLRGLKSEYKNSWEFDKTSGEFKLIKSNMEINGTFTNYIRHLFNQHKPIKEEMENLVTTRIGAYSSFTGSPLANGQFQFDLWGVSPTPKRYDWDSLRKSIIDYGVRNSLLVAPMPTASTAQILGNNECFEPFTSNIYVRRTNAGDHIIVNKYLLSELMDLGLWSPTLKNQLIADGGSVQRLDIPKTIKDKYKTAWEISMQKVIDMAKDRGAFICQSQSMNLWMAEPTFKNLTAMHMYSWKSGLKTGMYYLRTKPKAKAQQFTVEPVKQSATQPEPQCDMCSS
jgi:ribonucleotide reductase alpha subunit